MKNILVGQSGGPTAVINASLYGVIKEGLKNEKIDKVYGMINGIEGFLQDKYMDLTVFSDEELEMLKITPGAYLGSCRYKLPKDYNDDTYKKLFKKFSELNIEYVLYIGGNDSMDTANKLSHYANMVMSNVKIIGIPKTIDNDLPLTDHTPGFGSAAKFVASAVKNITLDAEVYDKESITIVEIMGRHAGWLTAASMISRKYEGDNPVLIYLPEAPFDLDKFYKKVEEELKNRKNLVICVSEGIKDVTGKFICEYESEAKTDAFGHKNLTGCGKVLENLLKERLNVKVRSIELNVLQRCFADVLSKTDLEEAAKVGSFAVSQVVAGKTAKMVAINRKADYIVEYTLVEAKDVCNKEKLFPSEWIINDGSNINDEFRKYISPLIEGDVSLNKKEGTIKALYRKNN